MRRRPRILGVAFLVVVGGTACNAILGIHDLSAPDVADAGDGAAAETGTDGSGQVDGSLDAACDGCVTDPQTGGSIYPTWRITSDLNILNATGSVPATNPIYEDAGPGALRETHSGLTWTTAALRGEAGAGLTLAEAKAECAGLGAGWRVPTRIELSTIQYRTELDASTFERTRCLSADFDLYAPYPYAWTTTTVPGSDGGDFYIADESRCAFGANPPDSLLYVHCVKGATSPARFEIIRERDTVHALDTDLEWERVGKIVSSFTEAKAHCDGVGMRLPVAQELYSIVDTRQLLLTDTRLFPQPPPTSQGFLSQTIAGYDTADGGAYYTVVATVEGSRGWEDTLPPGNTAEKVLIRCVRQFRPLP